nr:uncharacterized protein LOC104090289 isoform X2 [Nicotiana tomentosiformis]
MPGAIPNLKSLVRDLASTSTYAEHSWRDLSKGRWEAKNYGLGKYAVMRPSSRKEETSAPVPKLAKDNKRKRASTSKHPTLKTKTARKPRKNTIPLTEESVRRLRDEDEEEEENDGSILVARVKKSAEAPKATESMKTAKILFCDGGVLGRELVEVPESSRIEATFHHNEPMVGTTVGDGHEAPRDGENAPSDSLGVIEIRGSPLVPSFSEEMIREARALKTLTFPNPREIHPTPYLKGLFNGVQVKVHRVIFFPFPIVHATPLLQTDHPLRILFQIIVLGFNR